MPFIAIGEMKPKFGDKSKYGGEKSTSMGEEFGEKPEKKSGGPDNLEAMHSAMKNGDYEQAFQAFCAAMKLAEGEEE